MALQKLESIGQTIWLPPRTWAPCQILDKFCTFSIQQIESGCTYRTIYTYDDEAAYKKGKHCGSDASHNFQKWGRMKVHSGSPWGSPDYVKATIEACIEYDCRYLPYRRVEYYNVRYGVTLKEICQPNQSQAGAILDLICGN